MNETIILTFAGIALLILICQWLSWLIKVPSILLLLISGIIIGPVLGWVKPNALFGPILPPVIQLAVAIILFEGSLTLNASKMNCSFKILKRLVTIGTLITTAATAFFTYTLFNISIEVAILFGAVVSVTGPTVIVPILRTVRPSLKVSNILRWEGIIIDPIGAILSVFILGVISATRHNVHLSHITLHFAEMIAVATISGLAAGYGLGHALRNHWIPEFLHNVITFTLVIIIYTVSNHIDDGSGLVAVTLMGLLLANMKDVHIDDILGFKESLSILLISAVFIILAANVQLSQLHNIIWTSLLLVAAIQFIVRPLCVLICAIGCDINWRERLLISWIAPRGIVAAAIAALFAIHLKEMGIKDYNLLPALTFMVIIGTVIFQSITSGFVAKLLRVAEPEAKGFLIIGANIVAREISKALTEHGYHILHASPHWNNSKLARMEGLNVYYGNPVSDHADRNLDLVGIGCVLAITPEADLNSLATIRYRREFGANNTYSIQTKLAETKSSEQKHFVATRDRGKSLFGKDVTYAKLDSFIAQGAKVTTTLLTDNFNFETFQLTHKQRAIPLFAISPRNKIHLFTDTETPNPEPDWQLVSLIIKDSN